jgi:hypothetical protein
MKAPKWKIVLYALFGVIIIGLYFYIHETALLVLAPIGFIIYLIESYESLKQFKNWGTISGKEKQNAILSLLVLAIIAAVIVLILVTILSTLK